MLEYDNLILLDVVYKMVFLSCYGYHTVKMEDVKWMMEWYNLH